jgi:hypothetical protein
MTTTHLSTLTSTDSKQDALVDALKAVGAYNGVSRVKVADLRVYAAKVARLLTAGNPVDGMNPNRIDHAVQELEVSEALAAQAEIERVAAEQQAAAEPTEAPVAPAVEVADGGLSNGEANEIAAVVTAEVQAAIDLLVGLGYAVRAPKVKASTGPKATDGARSRFEAIIEHGVKADDGSIVATADVLRAAGCPESWCKYAALFAPSGNAYATAVALGYTPRLRTVEGEKALVLVPVAG